MTDDRKDHTPLAEALADSLAAIDAAYKEEMRELRAIFQDAKAEAEKDEPDSVKLKALLADANEAARTFSILDPAWQVVQRVSKMLGFL